MNSALLKEREEFRKRAMAVPVVENKKRKVEEPSKKSGSSKPPVSTEKVRDLPYTTGNIIPYKPCPPLSGLQSLPAGFPEDEE